MPKFANKLDRLLADVVLASKFERLQRLDIVRDYLKTTNRDRLIKEVNEITSEPELRQLAGAGVPGYLQDAFLCRMQKLTPQRGRN